MNNTKSNVPILLALLFSCFCLPANGFGALRAHWTFDETSGATAHDSAGYHPGTLAGSAAWIPAGGKAGGAISLAKATGDYVTMGDVLNLGTGPSSLVLWVKTSSTDTSTVVLGKHWSGFPSGYIIGVNSNDSYGTDNKAWFYNYHNGLEPISTTTVNDDQWHQIIATRGDSQVKIYVDGLPVEDTEADDGLNDPPAGTPLLIGGYAVNGNPLSTYTGLVDDVQIYDHMLTEDEIQWLYDHPGQTPACTPPPADMVAWWGGDNNTLDMIGANHGTLHNGATYGAGKVDQGFSLDGINDYVNIPTLSSQNFPSAFTIDAWVKADSLPETIEVLAGLPGGYQLDLRSNGKITFGNSGAMIDSTATLSTNTFVHVAATFEAGNVKIYINGTLDTEDVTTTYSGTTIPFQIGGFDGFATTFFHGVIDELELYNRILTPVEIAAIYNAGSAGMCRSCTAPPADMVAWWGGNNTHLDLIGVNHGTLENGVSYDTGKVGEAFSFDGVDDYVSIPDSPILDITDNITIDAWIYRKDNSHTGLLNKGTIGTNGVYDLAIYQDKFYFRLNGAALNMPSNTSIPVEEWTHVTGTYDGTTAKIYINGALDASQPYSDPISTNSSPLHLGLYGQPNIFFKGLIDELEIFGRALDADEIAAIYNAGSAGKCRSCASPASNMVAWWKAENNAEDNINTHDGTLVNGATFASGKVGTAFSFDGADDAVHVGMLGNVGLNETQPFSLSAWVNSHDPATGSQVIAGNYMGEIGGLVNFSTCLRINDSKLVFTIDQRQLAGTTIETEILSGWQYVTATYDGTSLKLFINGTLKSSTDRTFSGSTDNARGWDIGNFSPETNATHGFNSSFNGEIDELAIFNRALTADEIATLYNAGNAGQCDIDTTPDAFAFTDQTDVNVSTVITHDPFIVSGINYAANIAITSCTGTNCEYQINSDGWTSIAGTVNNGDTITVRQTSSAGYSTQTNLALTIGGVTDTFSVTTMAIPQYTVTPNKTGSGTISPDTPQTINHGSTTTFTVTPDNGYSVSMGGTCGGTLVDTTYTTDAVTSDCTVISTFTPNTYTVTPSKTGSGTISPSAPQTINHGGTTTFTVTPDAGHSVSMGSTCGGTLVDTTYTTDAVTADCTVTATFTPNTYTVTPSKTGSGTITPATQQTINHGSTTTFTVTPSAGYSASVNGTCGGTLVGTTYTTNAVTLSCTVIATFTLNTYTFTITKTGTGSGKVTSNPTGIDCGAICSADYDFGDDVTLTATPAEGSIFKGWSGSGCSGTGDCTVTMDEQKNISASFQQNFPWPMFLPAISKGRE